MWCLAVCDHRCESLGKRLVHALPGVGSSGLLLSDSHGGHAMEQQPRAISPEVPMIGAARSGGHLSGGQGEPVQLRRHGTCIHLRALDSLDCNCRRESRVAGLSIAAPGSVVPPKFSVIALGESPTPMPQRAHEAIPRLFV